MFKLVEYSFVHNSFVEHNDCVIANAISAIATLNINNVDNNTSDSINVYTLRQIQSSNATQAYERLCRLLYKPQQPAIVMTMHLTKLPVITATDEYFCFYWSSSATVLKAISFAVVCIVYTH